MAKKKKQAVPKIKKQVVTRKVRLLREGLQGDKLGSFTSAVSRRLCE
jgi:hypothetical protein